MGNVRQSEQPLPLHRADPGDQGGADRALIASAARRSAIDPGTVIQMSPGSATYYVVESGLVSLRFGNGSGVEVGMVGRGDIIGLPALLLQHPVPFAAVATTRCQLVGIPGTTLRPEFLHATVARRWAEAAILARCNAQHSLHKRVARWTLTAHRHVGDQIGPISHDRLAALLGVRRASVTVALQELESAGSIRSIRKFIVVRDTAALEQLSCECGVLLAALLPRSSVTHRSANGDHHHGEPMADRRATDSR